MVALVVLIGCGWFNSPAAVAPDAPVPAPEAPVDTPIPGPVVKIALGVSPGDGSAWRIIEPTGRIDAGHMEGAPPFVHQDTVEVGPDVVKPIFEAAQALIASDAPTSTGVAVAGTVSLELDRSTGESVVYRWKFGEEPADPRIKTVSDPVYALQAGGW
jgi:hypothetical protein